MNAEIKSARRSSMTLLEGLALLVVLGGLVWLIAWGVQRTKKQAERSHARKVLREEGFILVLDQKDHAVRSDDLAGLTFKRPLLQSKEVPFQRELISQIALFDELQILKLRNSFLTDDELKSLSSLRQLRELDISGSVVTDEGLSVLAEFPELEELDISLTKVRGPGLRHLKSLEKLRVLRVTNNEIPDSALPYLEMLTQLKSIDVRRTWLSNESKEKLNAIRVKETSRFTDRYQAMRNLDFELSEYQPQDGIRNTIGMPCPASFAENAAVSQMARRAIARLASTFPSSPPAGETVYPTTVNTEQIPAAPQIKGRERDRNASQMTMIYDTDPATPSSTNASSAKTASAARTAATTIIASRDRESDFKGGGVFIERYYSLLFPRGQRCSGSDFTDLRPENASVHANWSPCYRSAGLRVGVTAFGLPGQL
jgi:hypothetical protein